MKKYAFVTIAAAIVTVAALAISGCGGEKDPHEGTHNGSHNGAMDDANGMHDSGTTAMGELKPQTTCPVMGNPVTKSSQAVDVRGQRIYICCPGCEAELKADPEKYLQVLHAKGQYAESLQENCPIMTGNKVTKDSDFVEYKGRRIHYCCPGCKEPIEADPAKYADWIAEQAGN